MEYPSPLTRAQGVVHANLWLILSPSVVVQKLAMYRKIFFKDRVSKQEKVGMIYIFVFVHFFIHV